MDEQDTPRVRHWGHSEDKINSINEALDTVELSLGGKITVQQQMAIKCGKCYNRKSTGHPDLHQRAVTHQHRVGMSFKSVIGDLSQAPAWKMNT